MHVRVSRYAYIFALCTWPGMLDIRAGAVCAPMVAVVRVPRLRSACALPVVATRMDG